MNPRTLDTLEPRGLQVSVGQRMMWLLHHYQGAHGALNCPIILALAGRMDVDRLGSAWQQVVNRHESLRTSFHGRGRALRRRVHGHLPLNLIPEPLPSDAVNGEALQVALRDELRRPIQLEERAHRTRLWRLKSDLHVLCINQHHLVTDALSCGLVSRDLGFAYEGRSLPELVWQFSDFVEWEARELRSEAAARCRDYWTGVLSGLRLTELPRRPEGATVELAVDTITLRRALISADARRALEAVARQHKTTLFTLMLSLFFVHLQRLTGEHDLAVSTLLANRAREESRQTVGFLANMVMLRARLHPGDDLSGVIAEVRSTVSGGVAHQAFPYQLLDSGVVPANAARDIVFQMFAEATHQTTLRDLEVSAVDPPSGLARRFDLDLAVIPTAEGMQVVLAAADRRFRPAWAKAFLDGFVGLVRHAAERPEEVSLT